MVEKISIIVPVYNAQDYIEECVQSIIAQTYKNWEMIIINDGSTDCTDDICRALCSKDDRIKYVKKSNEGVSKARNMGLEMAKGDIILFVDADDWAESDMLEVIVDAWRPETDLLMFGFYEIRDQRREECQFFDKNIQFADGHSETYNKQVLVLNILQYYRNNNKKALREIGVPWAKAFSAKKIREHNLVFPEEMTLYEDCIFLMNCIPYFDDIVYLRQPLYNYRVNATSICNTVYKNREICIRNFKRRSERVLDFIEKNYPDDDLMWDAFCQMRVRMICDTLWWAAQEKNRENREPGYNYCQKEAYDLTQNYPVSLLKDRVYVWLCKHRLFGMIILAYKLLYWIQGEQYR